MSNSVFPNCLRTFEGNANPLCLNQIPDDLGLVLTVSAAVLTPGILLPSALPPLSSPFLPAIIQAFPLFSRVAP